MIARVRRWLALRIDPSLGAEISRLGSATPGPIVQQVGRRHLPATVSLAPDYAECSAAPTSDGALLATVTLPRSWIQAGSSADGQVICVTDFDPVWGPKVSR